MPVFDFTDPNGQQYSVTGPDGATSAQAFDMLQRHLKAQDTADDTAADAADRPPLSSAVTDVPSEVGSATMDALRSVGSYLNPFSDERRKAYERGDVLGPTLSTGKGLLSAIGLPGAPVQGAARSLIGHPLDVADNALRQGAVALHGENNVPPAVGYEGAKGEVDKALMAVSPRGANPRSVTAPAAAPTASPALQANIAAQNVGVDLPRAIATDSPTTRFVGQVVNKMPGGGPMQTGISRALEQTGEAVGQTANLAGGVSDPLTAGQGFQSAIQNSFKPAAKASVSTLYDAVDQHMPTGATYPLNDTRAAIQDIVSRRAASGENTFGSAAMTALEGATRPGGLTYPGIKDLRTRVGEMLDTGAFPEGMSQGELRRIYGSLSTDLRSAIQTGGGQQATSAFNRANAYNGVVQDWRDNLGKILGADSRSAEGVTSALVRAASTGPGADLKALGMARMATPQAEWRNIASTAVSTLGQDRKGQFSPAIFLNNFNGLSAGGKSALFDSATLSRLNDIATISQKFVDSGKLANTSGTAGHSALYATIGAAITGALHGSMVEPAVAVGTIGANNLLARRLAAPASASSTARRAAALSSGPSIKAGFPAKLAISGSISSAIPQDERNRRLGELLNRR